MAATPSSAPPEVTPTDREIGARSTDPGPPGRARWTVLPPDLRLPDFLVTVAQLGLLALIIRQFQIETAAFQRLALLAFAGFAVHALLPMRYRLPFFALLSLGGIAMIFGPVQAAWLVGLGLGLIAICHLPVAFRVRVALLVVAGIALVAQRAGWLPAPWSQAIWPILGSMFMFRLIVYMYDLRHETVPVSPWRTLSYFFLLPNVCFPLFPVVDYKTFRRTYYDTDSARIHQVGVDWMLRGVVHLLLYRIVYYYFTLAPSEVTGAASLAQFLVSNFLLYLRVSGQFHLIVGLLLLFGFHLPETHHGYFLASSFTDFWRRINIYWKDFMLKIFYYPAYFRLRASGPIRALVLSTLVVFFATWLLHAYQWFWLRGSFLLTWPDVTFWSVLAGLVVVNSLYEMKHGRARTLGPGSPGRRLLPLALRTGGTFAVICVLWSLWTSESLSEWLHLWTVLADGPPRQGSLAPVLVLTAAVVVGMNGGAATGAGWRFRRTRATTVASLAGLALLGVPAVYHHFGPQVATAIHSLRSATLSRLDVARLERGYYEDLLRVDRFNSQLWELYMHRPVRGLTVEGSGLDRFTGDFAQRELIPSATSTTPYGTVSTNRWGMRDQDYDRLPAPGTYRIAVLGASSVMGWGVGDGETFEALVERRLNAEKVGAPFARYELLNFAVPGYYPLQQVPAAERALTFGPHALLYVATGREASRSALYLAEVVRKGIAIPYEDLREIVRAAGIDPRTEESVALRRLEPHRVRLLAWIYKRIADECARHGVAPILVFLPQVEAGAWQEETPIALRTAEAAGFTVVDLSDVFQQVDVEAVRLEAWDNHPNARGHALVARRLYDELIRRWDLIASRH